MEYPARWLDTQAWRSGGGRRGSSVPQTHRAAITRASAGLSEGRLGCTVGRVGAEHGKVIRVDFGARRRQDDDPVDDVVGSLLPEHLAAVLEGREFVVFWRPEESSGRAEYLGGRFDRGWMLFVWTGDDLIGQDCRTLVEARGYVPQHLERGGLRELIACSKEVGGMIVNGDIDPEMRTIRAAAEQIARRGDALRLLRS